MVAKISIGNSLYGALVYNGEKLNKEKGKLISSNKIYNDGSGILDIRRAFEDFKRWIPANTRTERPMMHISLNPHPDDRLTDAQFSQLADDYMKMMGFENVPFIVFKHEDIDRYHLHIVALRVDTDGRCISDKNNFYKNKKVCRELEKKYGLKVAEREKVSPDTPVSKVDPNGDIKRQVQNTVKLVGMRWQFQSIGEYNAILGLYNVRCEMTDGKVNGREYHGLVYFATDDNGNTIATPLKASRLGKFASRTAVEGKFERDREKIDIRPTKRLVSDAMAAATGKDDFIVKLKEKNIDLVLRYNADGRLYGATFVDHNNHVALNGSRLGREFSANALNLWFNDPTAKPQVKPQPRQSQGQQSQGQQSQGQQTSGQTQPNQPQQQPRQKPSRSDDFDYSPMLPGLELFQTGPDFDPAEEAFARRARKKKKKKGRGL
ncbi:conjugal transfer protein MobB [uncultured Duncaniella sp.]|uniref:conjugal transfer protein MobB n=1 Tax=uncultured Duncaniella sp. TaxID=2768039 RepID=UPI0025B7319F|nr:conjugal transfer protein MobB [uncultured Duncaniella sp.]